MPHTPHPLKTVTQAEWDLLMKRIEVLEQAAQVKPSTEVAVVEKQPAPRTRATRLPEGWVPPDEVIEQMIDELHVTAGMLSREHRKFVDYWVAQPGQRGVKLSWVATWRNWMRKASEGGSLGSGRTTSRMDEKVSGWMELGDATASQ